MFKKIIEEIFIKSSIEKADNALYESKRLGKNTISLQKR